MTLLFAFPAVVAVAATLMVVTRREPASALLYLILSFLSLAVVFYLLGAPFAAVMEVIVYAGAILVLFLFVIMMLNLGKVTAAREAHWTVPKVWPVPVTLAAVLLAELLYVVFRAPAAGLRSRVVGAREVGAAMFGPYLLVVELASFLLLAGLVAAFHLGRRPGADASADEKEAR